MSTIARCRTVVGSLYGLLRNRLGLSVATPLGAQELSATIAPDRRLVVLGHEPIAGFTRDHGTVADEAAMLALHTLDGATLLAEPTFVAAGDSVLRTDDPGWRWHCLCGHGTQLSDWERHPLAGSLSGLAVSGHTHEITDITELQSELDGKQAASANLTALASIASTTAGRNLLTVATPSGPKLVQVNADGSISLVDASSGGGSSTALESLIVALAPVAWYRADAGALDADGTACTDGVAIASWQDQSGHGYHLAQATAGLRPTLETSERNGLPVVRYDGIDDYLIASAFPSIDLTNVTVFAVFQQRGATAERGVFVIGASGSGGGWGSTQRIYGATGGTSLAWGVVARETVATLAGDTATPWGVWTHRVVGSAVTAGRNGTDSSTATGASMSPSLEGLLIGGYWDSGVALPTGDLDIAECIVVPQGLPDATIALLASLLRAKYGI